MATNCTFGDIGMCVLEPFMRSSHNLRLQKLLEFVQRFGVRAWQKVFKFVPDRTPIQCRERWAHHLGGDS